MSSFEEYKSDYFDLDDILAEQQKMQVSFKEDIPGLGFLENNPGEPLHKDEKVLLPFWIITELSKIEVDDNISDDGHIIELSNPKCFKNQFKNQLIAGPTSVQLYQACPYYFQFGYKLSKISGDETLPLILETSYKLRIPLIMDYSQQIQISKDKAEFIRGLDECERQ
eukprot:jgi/Orpsp1_1/1180026/evm.model.c7180000071852.1